MEKELEKELLKQSTANALSPPTEPVEVIQRENPLFLSPTFGTFDTPTSTNDIKSRLRSGTRSSLQLKSSGRGKTATRRTRNNAEQGVDDIYGFGALDDD
jgi:hypothetical protein